MWSPISDLFLFQEEKENEDVDGDEGVDLKKVKRSRPPRQTFSEEKDVATLTMQELIHYRPKRLAFVPTL